MSIWKLGNGAHTTPCGRQIDQNFLFSIILWLSEAQSIVRWWIRLVGAQQKWHHQLFLLLPLCVSWLSDETKLINFLFVDWSSQIFKIVWRYCLFKRSSNRTVSHLYILKLAFELMFTDENIDNSRPSVKICWIVYFLPCSFLY